MKKNLKKYFMVEYKKKAAVLAEQDVGVAPKHQPKKYIL